ncbi:MAG: FAD:protein FMN transferase [Euryarchaeota archaeon]|nr:FAD:protein FMN transferase [Euryarchaeota archaeon]
MDARKIAAVFLLLIVAAFFCIISTGPEDIGSTGMQHESRQAMGTIVTIQIIVPENRSEGALHLAFDEINRIEDLMDIHKKDSEISRLNEEGRLENASPDLIYVIDRSIYYSGVSEGAFDITIHPVLELWRTRINAGKYPANQEISDTLTLVNYSNVTVENDTVGFEMEGMSIDLGGIAKGYAVDRAVEVLKGQGFDSGFVNAGGDGMYFGTKPDGSPWRVGLRNPDNKTESIVVLDISDMAVSTSGNYERYFNESARLSHISDPRTGYSSRSLISATVIAASAMEADALATAVFVLGPEEGMELIEKTENTEALLITPERQILKSSGFDTYKSSINSTVAK